MPNLNMSVGGDFNPILKYDARSGRFRVRMEGGEEVDIAEPRLAVDFDSIKTGWICYPQGQAPQRVWDVNGVRQPRPGPVGAVEFKEGFEVNVYGGDPIRELSGQKLGLREWGSTANACKAGVLNAHAQYLQGQAANPGALPVYRMTGVKTIKTKNGTNYEPVFVLDKWVARSAIPAFGNGAHPQQPQGNGAPAVAPAAPTASAAAPALTAALIPPTVSPSNAMAASEF